MTKLIPSTKVKNNFGLILEETTKGNNDIIVTKMGKPQVVILDINRYEKLLDALEITQEQKNPIYQKKLKKAKSDIKLGKTISLKELEEKYLGNEV